MDKTNDEVKGEYPPKLGILVEFGFGTLLILAGLYLIFPLFELRIAIIIVAAAYIPVILYVAVILFVGSPTKWPYDAKGVDRVVCIMILSSVFLIDIIHETGVAIVSVICGVLVILLSSWHLKIQVQEDAMSNNLLDSM